MSYKNKKVIQTLFWLIFAVAVVLSVVGYFLFSGLKNYPLLETFSSILTAAFMVAIFVFVLLLYFAAARIHPDAKFTEKVRLGFSLLFSDPSKEFVSYTEKDQKGTWKGSYHSHKKRRKFALTAFSSVILILLCKGIVVGTISLLVVFGIVGEVSAVPNPITINFQGRMTNRDGSYVPDGKYDLEFNIYGTSSGVDSLWKEIHSGSEGVEVDDSVFNVSLGTITPLALDFNSSAYYLGIKVNGEEEMVPRSRIGGSAYAVNAAYLGGVSKDDFTLDFVSENGAETDVKLTLTKGLDVSGAYITSTKGINVPNIFFAGQSGGVNTVSTQNGTSFSVSGNLTVAGKSEFSNSATFNGAAAFNESITMSNGKTITIGDSPPIANLGFYTEVTSTNATSDSAVYQFYLNYDPSSNSSTNVYGYRGYMGIPSGNANNAGNIYGNSSDFRFSGSGTVNSFIGFGSNGQFDQDVTDAYASKMEYRVEGGKTVTNLYGGYESLVNMVLGTAATVYGDWTDVYNDGTSTTAYGHFVRIRNFGAMATGIGLNVDVGGLGGGAGNLKGIVSDVDSGENYNLAGEFTSTFDNDPSTTENVVYVRGTTAGADTDPQRGMTIDLEAGFTGNAQTNAMYAENKVANTGSTDIQAAVSAIYTSGNVSATADTKRAGLYGSAEDADYVYGAYFDTGDAGTNSYGVYADANGVASQNFGLAGFASNASGTNYGVYGSATAGVGTNYGVYGVSVDGVGVYGTSTNSYGVQGFSAISYAGYFSGDLHTTGDFTADGSKAGYVVDVGQNDFGETIEQGDLVVLTGHASDQAIFGDTPVLKIRKCRSGDKSGIIGIVDRKLDPSTKQFNGTSVAPLQYAGIVTLGAFKTAKADASEGAINVGDALTISSAPGHVKKATKNDDPIVGEALSSLASGKGRVKIYVQVVPFIAEIDLNGDK